LCARDRGLGVAGDKSCNGKVFRGDTNHGGSDNSCNGETPATAKNILFLRFIPFFAGFLNCGGQF